MLLSVVVSLYTSRVVLEVLGVEDYGLYGLVGGVVSMFSFLNSTMAGATTLPLAITRGSQLESAYSSADIETLNEHLTIWKAQTSEVVAQEVGSTDRNFLLFISSQD